MKTSKIICLLIFALSCSHVHAQQQPQRAFFDPIEPRTRLEALQLKIGAVIVRGSQRVGTVRHPASGRVEVAALEVIDTGSLRVMLKLHGTVASSCPRLTAYLRRQALVMFRNRERCQS